MNRRTSRILGLAVTAGVVLAGCSDAREQRLAGAQRALAALPDVEIVQQDAAGGVLTVRSRSSGVVSTIDLMSQSAPAGIAARDTGSATSGAASGPNERPASVAASTGASAGSAQVPDRSDTGAGTVAAGTLAAPVTAPGAPGAGQDGIGAVAGGSSAAVPLAATATVVRDPQGRVQRIEGSGFSIERTPGAARAAVADRPRTVGVVVPAATTTGAIAGERRRLTVPFVCGAGEARTLQGVELDVPGAGIIAERGCTLTLANVRVRSGGWGLVVNPGATVRVDDSLIEGRTGALDLYPGASLSSWATTFRGALGRPVATPQFVDRGGNAWD